jgi:hypothetical protein
MRKPAFDEVMIVNPAEPGANQGVRLMQFYPAYPSAVGSYAEMLEPYGQMPETYGYYGQAPEMYGYYAQAPQPNDYYGEILEPYGYYGQVPEAYDYYGQVPEPYGYYGEALDPYSYYGEFDPVYPGYGQDLTQPGYVPVPQYGEPYPLEGYGQMPEMPGYAEYEPAPQYPGVAYYGDPYLAGYVRARPSRFNAGCPMPTNVAGFAEAEPLEGYVAPSSVNAACEQMTPQPGASSSASDYFKPLW